MHVLENKQLQMLLTSHRMSMLVSVGVVRRRIVVAAVAVAYQALPLPPV